MRLTVTVQQTGPASDQYLAVTEQANGREICRHTFTFDPDKLVDLEPQWLLEKATPRNCKRKSPNWRITAVASTPTSSAMGSG